MDVRVLDPEFVMTDIVDAYKSFIWTERFSDYGDFELLVDPTRDNRAIFKRGVLLSIVHSTRVMFVEDLSEETTEDGERTLKVTGRSYETVLERRVPKPFDQIHNPKNEFVEEHIYEGKPAEMVRQMIYNNIVLEHGTSTGQNVDHIPRFLVAGSGGVADYYPEGNIPEPTEIVELKLKTSNTHNFVKEVLTPYSMGHRAILDKKNRRVIFNVYTGSDRFLEVVFSPELDNFANTSSFRSEREYKNVAYVHSKRGSRVVYGFGVPPTISGVDRRVLFVNATEIDDDTTDPDEEMDRIGWDALIEHSRIHAVDGEVPPHTSGYIYDKDYYLGDLVGVVGSDGLRDKMRVTEQIFINDEEGFRTYPTLTSEDRIQEGVWQSAEWNIPWADVNPQTNWADV